MCYQDGGYVVYGPNVELGVPGSPCGPLLPVSAHDADTVRNPCSARIAYSAEDADVTNGTNDPTPNG